jgi:protein farnesyltransferase/geranylgeranyltransferase type-1 subunit alpha
MSAAAYTPYSQRPEWADVVPVELGAEDSAASLSTSAADAPPKQPASLRVVAISYTPEHADALGYFRAVLKSGELSARVLALTADVIRFNQADYTAWRVR